MDYILVDTQPIARNDLPSRWVGDLLNNAAVVLLVVSQAMCADKLEGNFLRACCAIHSLGWGSVTFRRITVLMEAAKL